MLARGVPSSSFMIIVPARAVYLIASPLTVIVCDVVEMLSFGASLFSFAEGGAAGAAGVSCAATGDSPVDARRGRRALPEGGAGRAGLPGGSRSRYRRRLSEIPRHPESRVRSREHREECRRDRGDVRTSRSERAAIADRE